MISDLVTKMEYDACKADPKYFFNEYIMVDNSLRRGNFPVDIKLNNVQELLIDECHENNYVISMQDRQSGTSTAVDAYLLWRALFTDDEYISVVAHRMSEAAFVTDRLQEMYDNLPTFLHNNQMQLRSKGRLDFDTCSIQINTIGHAAQRGRTIDTMAIDCLSMIDYDDASRFMLSTGPAIKSNGRIIITSSENEAQCGNKFNEVFLRALMKKNNFKASMLLKTNTQIF